MATYIYEVERDESLMGKFYIMPLLGTRSTKPVVVDPVVKDIDGPISFSPSGEKIVLREISACARRADMSETESTINLASKDGSEAASLVSIPISTISRRIAWSPKGDRIAAFLYSDLGGRTAEAILDLVDV